MLRHNAQCSRLLIVVVSVACSSTSQPTAATMPRTTARAASANEADARVLHPNTGTKLVFCTAPGLSIDLRLDSLVAASTPVAMGTAQVAAGHSNVGTHRDTDEVVYFLSTGGRAFVGSDTTTVVSDLMLYIPRGVRHGFLSAPDTSIRFVWVNVPTSLAKAFRRSGVAPGTACVPPKP
jgi:mannose-6-phosphate isomerase-like protein (cupin superfamily)